MNAKQNEHRQLREQQCQLLAIGALLANPSSLVDAIQPDEFLDKSVGGVAQSLKMLVQDSSTTHAKELVIDWLQKNCGVSLSNGEKFIDSIIRTVKENSRRRQAAKIVHDMTLNSINPEIKDSEYISELKRLIEEL